MEIRGPFLTSFPNFSSPASFQIRRSIPSLSPKMVALTITIKEFEKLRTKQKEANDNSVGGIGPFPSIVFHSFVAIFVSNRTHHPILKSQDDCTQVTIKGNLWNRVSNKKKSMVTPWRVRALSFHRFPLFRRNLRFKSDSSSLT